MWSRKLEIWCRMCCYLKPLYILLQTWAGYMTTAYTEHIMICCVHIYFMPYSNELYTVLHVMCCSFTCRRDTMFNFERVHPSPLSAHKSFFGCKHYSQVNKLLCDGGKKPIVWGYLPNDLDLWDNQRPAKLIYIRKHIDFCEAISDVSVHVYLSLLLWLNYHIACIFMHEIAIVTCCLKLEQNPIGVWWVQHYKTMQKIMYK